MALADGHTAETRYYGDHFVLFRDPLDRSDFIYYLCPGAILYQH